MPLIKLLQRPTIKVKDDENKYDTSDWMKQINEVVQSGV
jgi:hypothetical protein